MQTTTATPFTLTSEDASNPAALPPFFDALGAAARTKLNAPPEWEWCVARVLLPTDDTLLSGGVPIPRKRGRGRWKGVALQECVVTRAEMAAACAEYERATGKCYRCAGVGDRVTGWSSTEGRRTAPCNRCGATGNAPTATEAG